jgi:hypothetical protein
MRLISRFGKRLGIGLLLLVALAMVASGISAWWVGHSLQQRLAALRAAGEPTCFAELAPKPIAPEEDAAHYLEQAGPDLEAFAKEHGAFFKTPTGEAFDKRRDEGEGPTPEQVAAIGAILGHYPDLPGLLAKAAACKGYASRLDFTVGDQQVMEELMKNQGDIRTAARFLRWRMTLLLAEGKQDEALQAGLVIFQLARHHEGEPALINGLVAQAIRGYAVDGINLVLRAGPISDQLRNQLEKELALQDDPQRLVRVMKSERAISRSVARGEFDQAWWLPWLGKGLQLDILKFYDRLLPLLAQPWVEPRPQIGHLNDFWHSSPVSTVLCELLYPALESADVAEARTIATIRALRIINRLTSHADREGREARGLADLALPESAVIDPFSGQPLRLKQTDAGWVVYTVFTNGTDDDGNFQEMADWGLAPAGYPEPR